MDYLLVWKEFPSLIDVGNGGVEVDAAELGEVAPNGAQVWCVCVVGQDNFWQFIYCCYGCYTQATNVLIEGDPSLEIQATLSDLLVSSAFAVIPQQEFSDSQVLSFPDDRIQVTSALY